jgi:hypothetical protein
MHQSKTLRYSCNTALNVCYLLNHEEMAPEVCRERELSGSSFVTQPNSNSHLYQKSFQLYIYQFRRLKKVTKLIRN